MSAEPIKRGRGSGAGWTPFAAAKRCEMPWAKFKRGMENGDVNYVEFGGQTRVTDAEIRRIRLLHGLSADQDIDDINAA